MIYILALAIFLTADFFIILQNWTGVLVTVVVGGVLLLIFALVRLLVPKGNSSAATRPVIPTAPPIIPPAPTPVPPPAAVPLAPVPVASGLEVSRNTPLTASRPAGQTNLPGLFFALEICAVAGLAVLVLIK